MSTPDFREIHELARSSEFCGHLDQVLAAGDVEDEIAALAEVRL
jgi:hypothetical protein